MSDQERRYLLERRLKLDRAIIERRRPEMRRKFWESKRQIGG